MLKATIKNPKDVINEVFARDFGFDLETFKELKKQKFFKQNIDKINTFLIRSTIVQNSPSSYFLKNFLFKNTIYLKDILVQDIKRWVQPDYTEDWVKVIKTLNIQKWKIDTENEFSFVSNDFYIKNQEKASVNQYDLLLTSTWMWRWKFALYEDEEVALLDSHISKIVLNKEKINPFFLNYYCQSFFWEWQLKYIEMHIKWTPEIYAEQLKFFQIPDISLPEQQKIVDEIKLELNKQEKIKKDIEKERSKIDELIEESIKNL